MTPLTERIQPSLLPQTVGYFALFIYLGLGVAVLGPTLPALAEQVGRPVTDLSGLFLAGVGFTVGTALASRLFDRMPGHLLLAVAQLFSAAMLILIPLAPTFGLLVAIIAVKSVADGAINTGGNTLLMWTHGERVGPYMNALHFFFGLGAFVAPFIVAQVVEIPGGYRWAYWILAAIAGVISTRLLTLRGGPRPHAAAASTGAADTRTPVTHPMVLSALVFLFFYVGGEIAFGGWLYTYATQLNLANAVNAAYLTSAFWLSFTVGRLLSIPMATRFRPATIILTALGACLAVLALLMAVPNSSGMLWFAAIALGFSLAPIYATGFTLAGQAVQLSARVSGVILLGDSLGGLLLPFLVGPVIEQVGPRALVYLVFGSLFFCMLAFFSMLRVRPARAPVAA